MINWVIGLFVAALIAAFFGFSGMATTFAATAQVLFFMLVILFIVSAVVAMFGAQSPAVHSTVRTASLVVLVAAISIGTYAWIENDMSAEAVGRSIDRQTVSIASDAGAALNDAGSRTHSFVSRTVDDIRTDASNLTDDHPDSQETSRE
jgi:uncharacterized membrane protein YtjA (UPF0391 family)